MGFDMWRRMWRNRRLLRSYLNPIIKNFCDEEGCIIITPIVNLDGKWMHREFFDLNGFSERRARRIFGLK